MKQFKSSVLGEIKLPFLRWLKRRILCDFDAPLCHHIILCLPSFVDVLDGLDDILIASRMTYLREVISISFTLSATVLCK